MAKYEITFSCGHTETIQLVGKISERERKIEYFKNHGLCSECLEAERKRQFEEQNRKAAEEAKELGLPELTGTEKQVAWANTLRKQWIEKVESEIRTWITDDESRDEEVRKALKRVVEEHLINTVDARWWIDNRNASIHRFLEEAEKKYLETPQMQVPKEIEEQAIEEMTIRPSDPTTNLVAEIRVQEDTITAKYPEKDEDFREIVKGLQFTWNNGRWERKLGLLNGSSLDRAAELGVKLLASGFPVRVYDDELQTKIVNADYEPESTRWIVAHEKGVRVIWNRKEEDFYNEAKRLPGAKWISEKRSMYIPGEAFREIQDFAVRYGFKLTEKAQSVLTEATKAFEAAMVADVKAPEKERLPRPGGRPKLSADQVDGDIDETLRDDD